jgi:hypothetical protein
VKNFRDLLSAKDSEIIAKGHACYTTPCRNKKKRLKSPDFSSQGYEVPTSLTTFANGS